MLHKAHPIGGDVIDIRRVDLLLPVTAEIADAEIIREDENDVGFRGRGGLSRKGTAR
jgi:hypothetical protein